MFKFNKKQPRLHKFKMQNWKRMKPRQRKLYYAIHTICRRDFDTKAKREFIIAPYIIDVYIPKYGIAVEIDGSFHDNRQEYDSRRDSYLDDLGILTLRFDNEIVDNYLESVVETIKKAIIKRINLSLKIMVDKHNIRYYTK